MCAEDQICFGVLASTSTPTLPQFLQSATTPWAQLCISSSKWFSVTFTFSQRCGTDSSVTEGAGSAPILGVRVRSASSVLDLTSRYVVLGSLELLGRLHQRDLSFAASFGRVIGSIRPTRPSSRQFGRVCKRPTAKRIIPPDQRTIPPLPPNCSFVVGVTGPHNLSKDPPSISRA